MLKGEGDSQPSLTLNAYYVHTVTCRVRCIHACMHLLALAAHHVSFSGAWRLARQTRTLHDLRDGGESCLFYIYCMINILLNLLQSEDSYWRASDTLHDLRDGGESCLFVIVWSTVNTLFCCGGRIPTGELRVVKNLFGSAVEPAFDQILIFFFAKIECDLYFLDRFDVLMSKIIFKKWKNIINMYFGTKSYLKSNHYHIAKHALTQTYWSVRLWYWIKNKTCPLSDNHKV